MSLTNYKNYIEHKIFVRNVGILTPKSKPKIISAIEVQKNFMKSHDVKLSKLWHSEAYKTTRYVNFVMAGYNNK